MARPKKVMRHGTRSMYVHRGCRCQECRDANAAYSETLREARGLRLHDAPHGSVNAYVNWGCRCAPCTLANSVYLKARRAPEASI